MDEAPAFDPELLLDHQEFVRGLAKAILFDDHRADDVVQEAWLTALRRPPRHPAALRAWLATVVRNLARRNIRTRKRTQARELRAAREEAVPSTAEIAAREATRRQVLEAVLGLEEPFRSTVYLRFFEGLTPTQIGRRLGIPAATARSRLKRALDRLRDRLDQAHDGDRRSWCLALLPLALPVPRPFGSIFSSTSSRWILAGAAVLVSAVIWYTLRPTEAPTRPEPTVAALPSNPAAGTSVENEAPTEESTLRGRVVAGGVPLAGAYVYCYPVDRPDLVATTDPTDESGAFAFRFEGLVVLGAAHPGHQPMRRNLTLERGRVVELDIELPAGGALDIEVVDGANGRPVADAEIMLLRAGSPESVEGYNKACHENYGSFFRRSERMRWVGVLDWSDLMMATARYAVALHVPVVRTDARGEARLGGLPDGDVDLVVSHPSFVPARARSRANPLRVVLDRGGDLTVQAPRVDGRTAEGYVCRVAPVTPVMTLTLGIAMSEIDATGSVTFRHLPPGPVTVAITESRSRPPDDRAWSWEGNHRPLAGGRTVVVAGQETVLDLTAARAARLEGSVAIGDAPCSGWRVELHSGRGGMGGLVAIGETAADGTFRIDDVLPGGYTITVSGDGRGARREVIVPEGEESVDVAIEPGSAKIRGRVVGDKGEPLAKANVLLAPPFTPGRSPIDMAAVLRTIRAGTDATEEGEFLLENVEGGRHRILAVWNGRLGFREIDVANGQEYELELDLSSSERDRVRIRLTDGSGAPVAGHLFFLDAEGGLGTAIALQGPDFNPNLGATSEFEFVVPRGTYRLAAFAVGFAPRRTRLEVNGDDDVELRLDRGSNVFLELETGTGPLAGADVELRDEDGFAVPSSQTLMGTLWQARTPRTDGLGRVFFPRVAPGRYAVRVRGRRAGGIVVGDTPVHSKLLVPGR